MIVISSLVLAYCPCQQWNETTTFFLYALTTHKVYKVLYSPDFDGEIIGPDVKNGVDVAYNSSL